MVSWEQAGPFGAKLFMARRCFKCNVLRILLSEFDESQKETSLGIKVSCCVGGMSVVIMGEEHDWWTGFLS